MRVGPDAQVAGIVRADSRYAARMRRRPTSAVLIGALLAGCAGRGGDVRAPEDGKKPAAAKKREVAFVSPAQVFVLPELSTPTFVSKQPDSSKRMIVSGMRVVDHFDGTLQRGQEVFPGSQNVQAAELPQRLGGGFLFYSADKGSTSFWRSKTWAGKLESFANVDMDVVQVVAGFDRIYLTDRRSIDIVALDPDSGKAVDLGPLPDAVSYGSIAMLDAWVGAVEVPFQGILATFDAGASWRTVPIFPSYGVALENDKLILNTSRGKLELRPDGNLAQDQTAKSDALFAGAVPGGMQLAPEKEDDEPPVVSPSPLGRRPLHTAVLRGVPDSNSTALVLHEGAVGRVRLQDGAVLDLRERALSDATTCQGVRLGKGTGFVCGQERGRTAVYAVDSALSLVQVASYAGPRFVASSDNGALVVRGPCAPDADPSEGGYCVIDRELKRREIRVKGDVGVERVVALRDGRVAVIVPPRLGASGLVTIVDKAGAATSVKIKLPKAEASALALLKKGLWLDGFTEWRSPAKKGKPARSSLAGWVVAAGPFVGVRIDLDGKLHVGKIENDIGQSLISGPLALVKGRGGRGAESTDGGFAWREVELPAATSKTANKSVGFDAREQGCSRVGCAFGPWVRVGYRGDSDDEQVEAAETPKPTSLIPSQGGRWQLECAPTGVAHGPVAGPPAPKPPRRPRRNWRNPTAMSADDLESTEWLSFFGLSPPKRARDDIGVEHGLEHTSTPLRAYAWGARGASWDRVGSWQFRGFDAMSLDGAVWSTAVSRPPFSDAVLAAQAFGRDPNMPVSWNAALEAGGRAAGVLVNARGSMDLYLLEEGRAPIAVADVARAGLYQLNSVVKAGSTWYLAGAQGSNAFQVFRVVGNKLVSLRSYALRHGSRSQGRVLTNLVRTSKGDGLGVLVRSVRTRGHASHWYVYPLNTESGEAGPPLSLTPERLAKAPRPCGDGEDGYELSVDLPVEPYLDFVGSANAVKSRRVVARVLASVRGVCLSQLSGHADGAVPTRLAASDMADFASGRPLVPMTLLDRERTGRRWGFQCR